MKIPKRTCVNCVHAGYEYDARFVGIWCQCVRSVLGKIDKCGIHGWDGSHPRLGMMKGWKK